MIYVCAGPFAEGSSDYHFLLPLLARLLDDMLAREYTAGYELASSVGIDAPPGAGDRREVRIAAAVDDFWDRCTLFVVHSDGAGDPAAQRRTCVEPGLRAARERKPGCPIAACVPVRETEAWLLADPAVFSMLLGAPIDLPADPEHVTDPKQALKSIFSGARVLFASRTHFAFFGAQVDLASLRRLPAFQEFERELLAALRELAASQGLRD